MYVYILCAVIIALCAVLIRFRPDLINVLSEKDRHKMDPRKVGRIGFWGLMTTAAVLVIFYFLGIPSEIGMLVGVPGAIITAGLIQASIK